MYLIFSDLWHISLPLMENLRSEAAWDACQTRSEAAWEAWELCQARSEAASEACYACVALVLRFLLDLSAHFEAAPSRKPTFGGRLGGLGGLPGTFGGGLGNLPGLLSIDLNITI